MPKPRPRYIEVHNCRTITMGEFEGRVLSCKAGYHHSLYQVERVRGEWPDDADLLREVGGLPFGGTVRWCDNNLKELRVSED